MRKKFILLTIFSLLFLSFAIPAYSLRKRARKTKKGTGSKVSSTSRGAKAFVRFRPDRQGLLISISDFNNVESVSYEALYTANGLPQGVGGTINTDDSEVKNLYFGTCSSGVCTPHRNITNARLSIRSILKNGTVVLKPFRLKI